MGKGPPLAECTFGWGRVLRLYSDYLDVNGTPYALKALTAVHPTFRTIMGIPSARLELEFGRKKVILRGIPEIENARFVAEYLSPWCWEEAHREHRERPSTPAVQVQPWDERTVEAALPIAPPIELAVQQSQSEPLPQCEQQSGPARAVRRVVPMRPERRRREQRIGGTRHTKETLTVIPVPVRLLPGEEAFYSIAATLCDEPIGEASRISYPAKDYGTLILTSRRIIYIGRKSQVVIDYAHLLHVSRLRGAIAVQSDYRNRREIFEMRRPLECAGHLESILERHAEEMLSQPQQVPEDEEITQEEHSWDIASGGIDGVGRVDEMLPTEEVETGRLGDLQRNWRWQREHTRIRNTDDFEDRWQDEREVLPDALSDVVSDAVSQEPGGKDRG